MTGGILSHDWVASHQSLALATVFILGYAGIIVEEFFSFNKSGVALLTAVGMWTVRAAASSSERVLNESLNESLADVSQIVFFLIGAMTIVETVDAHAGFQLVTNAIGVRDKKRLVWLVGGITFFMSAILDNLTSTIVMVSLLRKLVKDDPEQRKTLGAVVVIAANAGGAWTPIGDVTTTSEFSAWQVLHHLSLSLSPSAVDQWPDQHAAHHSRHLPARRRLVAGAACNFCLMHRGCGGQGRR